MSESLSLGRLVVVGVGLIGGSLARALRRHGAAREIVGVGRSRRHLERAQALGVIDRFGELPDVVAGADVVVVAAPVGAMDALFEQMAPQLSPTALITDVGSVKGAVIEAARRRLGAHFGRFVPGHPIAGTEHSGVEASFASLFQGHRVILTPVAETDREAVATISRLWALTGAEVSEMGPDEHDAVLAATSHLPHVLAFGLVELIASRADSQRCFDLAAGGFYDFTRIASSDPVMWRDICLANRDALVGRLREYGSVLATLTETVERADGAQLEAVFRRAKQARDRMLRARENTPRQPTRQR